MARNNFRRQFGGMASKTYNWEEVEDADECEGDAQESCKELGMPKAIGETVNIQHIRTGAVAHVQGGIALHQRQFQAELAIVHEGGQQ